MKRTLLTLVGVVAVAIAAVPAAFASHNAAAAAATAGSINRHYTVRAGGFVMDNPSGGTVQTLGKFTINLHAGPSHKITYYDRTTGVSFHSLTLTNWAFTTTAAKFTGTGMVNGQRVHFTAIATDHPSGTDAFKIAWDHKAAHGSNLLSGNVRVTQIKLF